MEQLRRNVEKIIKVTNIGRYHQLCQILNLYVKYCYRIVVSTDRRTSLNFMLICKPVTFYSKEMLGFLFRIECNVRKEICWSFPFILLPCCIFIFNLKLLHFFCIQFQSKYLSKCHKCCVSNAYFKTYFILHDWWPMLDLIKCNGI